MQRTEIKILVNPIRNVPPDDIAGSYMVRIPAEIRAEDHADIAIESFHRAIPLSSPEDYEITVIDVAAGVVIQPAYGEVESVFDCKRTEDF